MKLATIEQLIKEGSLGKEETLEAIESLHMDGEIILLNKSKKFKGSDLLIASYTLKTIENNILEILSGFYKEYPLRKGLRVEDCANQVGISRKYLQLIASSQHINPEIEIVESQIRLRSHEIQFSANQQKLKTELIKSFEKDPFQPPSVDECIKVVGKDIYNALLDKGDFTQIASNVVYLTSDLDKIIKQTTDFFSTKQKISVSEIRDHLKTTRKYSVALLEYMDTKGITERIDDFRVLKKS